MALVDRFCIDRFEAHLVDQANPDEPHSPYRKLSSKRRYAAASKRGVVPQAYVNRIEADAACKNAGKRLCNAVEWYRACTGRFDSRYPYGAKWKARTCNTGKPHLLNELFGRVTFTYDDHYNNPKVNQTPGFLAKTGEYSECESAEGVYDLVGNLHEWVADDSSQIAKAVPLAFGNHLLGKKGSGVFMGGYFSSKGEHGKGCAYATTNHWPDYHDYSIGFRCCAEPGPEKNLGKL